MTRRTVVVPLLIAAFGLAGCANSGDGASPNKDGGSTPPPAASASSSEKTADWAGYYDCLAAQGLTLQDTGSGEKRVDKDANKPDAITKAEAACVSKLPAQGQADPAALAEARKISECMRKEGVTDYPDPDPKTGEVVLDGDLGAKIKGDPKVIEARKACSPASGGNSGGTVVGG
ncbi:hypothetical protein ACFC0D_11135 [Streptomyces sp. NPDC056222]|uniref:hypothetical protein n=1 Tax=Streptomyces sp. NPDC056222 TaxID=3345749 RepID=UPI0035D555C3